MQKPHNKTKQPWNFLWRNYLLLATSAAFAPMQPQQIHTHSALHMSDAVVEPPPRAHLTKWGDQISDILPCKQIRTQEIPEFAPKLLAQDFVIAGDSEKQL